MSGAWLELVCLPAPPPACKGWGVPPRAGGSVLGSQDSGGLSRGRGSASVWGARCPPRSPLDASRCSPLRGRTRRASCAWSQRTCASLSARRWRTWRSRWKSRPTPRRSSAAQRWNWPCCSPPTTGASLRAMISTGSSCGRTMPDCPRCRRRWWPWAAAPTSALRRSLRPGSTRRSRAAWSPPGWARAGEGDRWWRSGFELLRQSFAEMALSRGREPTPLLVALALSAASSACQREVRDALPGPPLDRYFRAATLCGLWLAARTGLARAWRDAGREQGGAEAPVLLKLEAALSPTGFLGGRSEVLQGGVTLYGLELLAGVPGAEELASRLASGGSAEEAREGVVRALGEEEDLARRAEQAAAVARLRLLLGEGLAGAEARGPREALSPLLAAFSGPGTLSGAVVDDASRKALLRLIQGAAPRNGDPLQRVAQTLRSWRQKEPGVAVGLSREAALRSYAEAAVALLADLALDRLATGARRAVSFRTGREAEGGADAEWEGGRLYRLSARPGPILRPQEERRVGHLFADVKDFTRRTALLGEASMAEFLRREFYGPILGAAKEHFSGMGHLADRGGVALNNLLGDAVSFSGQIEGLVSLVKSRPLPPGGVCPPTLPRGVERGGGPANRRHRASPGGGSRRREGEPERGRGTAGYRPARHASPCLGEATSRAGKGGGSAAGRGARSGARSRPGRSTRGGRLCELWPRASGAPGRGRRLRPQPSGHRREDQRVGARDRAGRGRPGPRRRRPSA